MRMTPGNAVAAKFRFQLLQSSTLTTVLSVSYTNNFDQLKHHNAITTTQKTDLKSLTHMFSLASALSSRSLSVTNGSVSLSTLSNSSKQRVLFPLLSTACSISSSITIQTSSFVSQCWTQYCLRSSDHQNPLPSISKAARICSIPVCRHSP